MSAEANVATTGVEVPDGDGTDGSGGIWQTARDNLKSGNLGVLPVVLGELGIVLFFGLTATNFFTASNFVNVILQMAGVTMIAFGVVFVLLLGEIDLSIGYLSGIAAVAAAELQLPGTSHDFAGWIAILIALAIVAAIGLARASSSRRSVFRRSSSPWQVFSSGRA